MRPHDWPERLRAHIVAATDASWKWGVHDCCTFARGAVLAVGGPDLGTGWAGAYHDEPGAQEAIRALGPDLEEAVASVCQAAGLGEVAPAFASRGDLLIVWDRVTTSGLPLVGVCAGAYGMAAVPAGLLRLPMRMTTRAWAV